MVGEVLHIVERLRPDHFAAGYSLGVYSLSMFLHALREELRALGVQGFGTLHCNYLVPHLIGLLSVTLNTRAGEQANVLGASAPDFFQAAQTPLSNLTEGSIYLHQ